MTDGVQVEINLDALRHNLQRVKYYAPDSRVIAMIKSNAYGHGLLPCAKALRDADAFGVARFDSAISLRGANVKQPIILMPGFFSKDDLMLLSVHQCDAVLHNVEQLELLEKTNLMAPIRIWIKINAGMNRLGFALDEVLSVHQRLSALRHVKQPINFMMHFAWNDPDKQEVLAKQYAWFKETINGLSGEVSVSKSAAIIAHSEIKNDWVRPGLMLYGVSPFKNHQADEYGLKPVMTVKAKLISVRHQKKGDLIGYDEKFQCPEDMLMGVAGIGYGDGYPAAAKPGLPMLIRDKRCALVGRVNMDMLHVDLRHCPDAKVGDEVTLFGGGLPIEEIAESSDLLVYSLLTSFGQRQCKIKFNESVPARHKIESQKNGKQSQPQQMHAR
jgi:alanine racemase